MYITYLARAVHKISVLFVVSAFIASTITPVFAFEATSGDVVTHAIETSTPSVSEEIRMVSEEKVRIEIARSEEIAIDRESHDNREIVDMAREVVRDELAMCPSVCAEPVVPTPTAENPAPALNETPTYTGGVSILSPQRPKTNGSEVTGPITQAPTVVGMPGTISGNVFFDENRNGIFEFGEALLSGWGISLYDNATTLLSTKYTNDAGVYLFPDIQSGSYEVEITLPLDASSAWEQTTPAGGSSHALTIPFGGVVSDANFGVAPLATVSGYVWYDLNNDGIWQTDGENPEPPLEHWTIEATRTVISNGGAVASGGSITIGSTVASPTTVSDTTAVTPITIGGAVPPAANVETKQVVTGPDGLYIFTFSADEFGDWIIAEHVATGWTRTYPTNSFGAYPVSITSNTVHIQDKNFGNIELYPVLDMQLAPLNGNAGSAPAALVVAGATIVLPSGSIIVVPTGATITSLAGVFDITTILASDIAVEALSGFSAGTIPVAALQWGILNGALSIDPPIAISLFVGTALNGETLHIVRSTSATGDWTNDGIIAPTTCTVSGGFCTFASQKASYFVATKDAPVVPPPPPDSSNTNNSGGGGGGSIGIVPISTPLAVVQPISEIDEDLTETIFPILALATQGITGGGTGQSVISTDQVLQNGVEIQQGAEPADADLASVGFLATIGSLLTFGTGNTLLGIFILLLILSMMWYVYRIFFLKRRRTQSQ